MSVVESSSVASKSKDGIPSWNGAAESFQAYQEAALLYEQTTPYQKRYLRGPKLQSALEGAALRLVVGKRPDWLSDNHGVTRLLEHLRKGLGRPQMPELTDLLNRYFRSTKRRANETMNEYVTRKAEVYVRAQQAMLRVQPVHGLKGTSKEAYDGWPPPHRGDGFPSWTWERAEPDPQFLKKGKPRQRKRPLLSRGPTPIELPRLQRQEVGRGPRTGQDSDGATMTGTSGPIPVGPDMSGPRGIGRSPWTLIQNWCPSSRRHGCSWQTPALRPQSATSS